MKNEFEQYWKDNLATSPEKALPKKKFNEGRAFNDSQDSTTKDSFDTYEGGEGGKVDSAGQPHKPFKPGDKTPPTKQTKKGIDFSGFKKMNNNGLFVDYEQTGGAPFQFFIEKAMATESGQIQTTIIKDADGNVISEEKLPKHLIVEGLASTTNVDHDAERMAPEALDAMVDCINKGEVQLRSEHSKDWDGLLGGVTKGWIDDRGQFHIKAELNKDSSKAIDLYKALKKGAQLGLSIAGVVKRAGLEMVESLGKKVKTFYDVLLKEVSVTNRPSNFDTWLVAKGIKNKDESGLDNLYKEYLSSSKILDWQYSIAKSIPDEFLKDSEQTNYKITNKNMNEKDLKMAKSIAMKAVEDAFKSMEGSSSSTTEDKECKAVDSSSTSDTTTDKGGESDSTTDSKTTETTDTTDTKGGSSSSSSTADTSEYGPDTTTSSDKEKAMKIESTKVTTHTKKEDDGGSHSETTQMEDKDSSSDSSDSSSSDTSSTSKKFEMDTLINEVTKRFEEKLAEHDKRVVGPLKEMVTKFFNQPKERKGIAIEKNFNGNEVEKNEAEELEKDLKDDKVNFQDLFKKNFSALKK